MSDHNSLYERSLYLSPEQRELLLAALSSTDQGLKGSKGGDFYKSRSEPNLASTQHPQLDNSYGDGTSGTKLFNPPAGEAPGPGQLGFDESPFLDFDFDAEFDINGAEDLIGEIPGTSSAGDEPETREKRKSVDGKEMDEGSKKRRESEEKSAKKPGRKPLTSEPTSKRKAQNRAAQRAFRERKEKHLKDLETKVEDLERASEAVNHENSLLRAQVERLQVEVKEYRKRLSLISSGNGTSPTAGFGNPSSNSRSTSHLSNNDFSFVFPKFGDLPGAHIFSNGSLAKASNKSKSTQVPSAPTEYKAPGILSRRSPQEANPMTLPAQFSSARDSISTNLQGLGAARSLGPSSKDASVDKDFSRPSSVFSRGSGLGHSYSGPTVASNPHYGGVESGHAGIYPAQTYGTSMVSNSDSPSSSSESQPGQVSSMGTSPEPSLNSPATGKPNEPVLNTISEEKASRNLQEGEKSFYQKLGQACGCVDNPVPAAMSLSKDQADLPNPKPLSGDGIFGFDWLAQQNGGQFDPVLFEDYRDSQDAILSQDFGSFFNEAFPLPDLDSPFHSFNDSGSSPTPKKNLSTQVDRGLEAENGEEVVPGEDRSQMLNCTKIWDRLQTMEKFRNGEIDVDTLCTELRNKARCSEGGVVVDKKDVEDIMTRAS